MLGIRKTVSIEVPVANYKKAHAKMFHVEHFAAHFSIKHNCRKLGFML